MNIDIIIIHSAIILNEDTVTINKNNANNNIFIHNITGFTFTSNILYRYKTLLTRVDITFTGCCNSFLFGLNYRVYIIQEETKESVDT